MVLIPGSRLAGRAAIGLSIAVALTPAVAIDAQEVQRGTRPLNLPRPGYEPRTTQIGPGLLQLEVDIAALYDSNVYATSRDAIDDIYLTARPRVDYDIAGATSTVHGEAYGDVREYLDRTRESSVRFGAALSGTVTPGRHQTGSTELRYDRSIQSRADPEARAGILARPRKIDVIGGQVGYGWQGRLGLDGSAGFQRFNYLDPTESDRNLKLYSGSLRASYKPGSAGALFAEGYVNRRDFVRRTDFTGIDRDATTVGLLLGASRDVTGRLTGRVGVGVFRSNPDDRTLRGFTGLAANGSVTWVPQVRTQVTGQIFRGDVGTVRVGATGRTDTRLSARIEQEARHNLLWNASAGWTRIDYRGGTDNRLNRFDVGFEANYLIDRRFSVFAGIDYTRRNADRVLDRFKKTLVQIGIRLRH